MICNFKILFYSALVCILKNVKIILGFYGVQESTQRIWIVYRGTESYTNWLDDAEARLVDAEYTDCAECEVHRGFKKCHDATIATVMNAAKTLHNQYPSFSIIVRMSIFCFHFPLLICSVKKNDLQVVGHSLGAALANLALVDLLLEGYTPLHYSVRSTCTTWYIHNLLLTHRFLCHILYQFGSPRVGNDAFSAYVKSLITSAQRITHYKDPVPHLPYESLNYVHIINEVYEDENHILHACVGNDDPHCAEQWAFKETNGDDHVLYLNHEMHCEQS
jgi:Lipase (class 3)